MKSWVQTKNRKKKEIKCWYLSTTVNDIKRKNAILLFNNKKSSCWYNFFKACIMFPGIWSAVLMASPYLWRSSQSLLISTSDTGQQYAIWKYKN